MKSEVYSWRLSASRKAELEDEARREGTSLASLLERITGDWLTRRRRSRNGDEAEQAELHRRVMATVGKIRSGDPTLASRAREIIRESLLRKHQKESRALRRNH